MPFGLFFLDSLSSSGTPAVPDCANRVARLWSRYRYSAIYRRRYTSSNQTVEGMLHESAFSCRLDPRADCCC